MDLHLQPDWQRTVGQRVQIWKDGNFVRKGTVEAVMPDSSCLWISAEGHLSRQMLSSHDGYQVFTHFLGARMTTSVPYRTATDSPHRDAVRNQAASKGSPWRTMFKSKIHRAIVTHADLHYVGSVTVDLDLLDAADILPGELVAIVDVANGARLETYIIAGERGSGVIGINDPAAHLVHENYTVILITYAQMTTEEAKVCEPHVVHVDHSNRIIQLGNDPAVSLTPDLLRPPFALNNAAL